MQQVFEKTMNQIFFPKHKGNFQEFCNDLYGTAVGKKNELSGDIHRHAKLKEVGLTNFVEQREFVETSTVAETNGQCAVALMDYRLKYGNPVFPDMCIPDVCRRLNLVMMPADFYAGTIPKWVQNNVMYRKEIEVADRALFVINKAKGTYKRLDPHKHRVLYDTIAIKIRNRKVLENGNAMHTGNGHVRYPPLMMLAPFNAAVKKLGIILKIEDGYRLASFKSSETYGQFYPQHSFSQLVTFFRKNKKMLRNFSTESPQHAARLNFDLPKSCGDMPFKKYVEIVSSIAELVPKGMSPEMLVLRLLPMCKIQTLFTFESLEDLVKKYPDEIPVGMTAAEFSRVIRDPILFKPLRNGTANICYGAWGNEQHEQPFAHANN